MEPEIIHDQEVKTDEFIDPAQRLYKEQNKEMDLNREIDPFIMWGFGLCLSIIFISGIPIINIILAPIVPVISIVLSIIGLNRIRTDKRKKGKGFAIAALIIAPLELLLIILVLAAIIFLNLPIFSAELYH
ncbi:hypothetical protein JXB31_03830 [Candidatus Woesearchaeota archaeon]|nr:hypothetical protein [Candidatus Woesearchaeota archaeon]